MSKARRKKARKQSKSKLGPSICHAEPNTTDLTLTGPISVEQLLAQGIAHCQSGELSQGESCLHQVLQQQPDNPDAWHLLGVIAAQHTHYPSAIERIEHAIDLKPTEAIFYHNLGNVYQAQGQLAAAISSYLTALQLNPDYPDARKNLDIVCEKQLDLGIEHHQSERFPQAEACYHKVLQGQANRADAWHLLGLIAYQQEQHPLAIERIQQAIQLNPKVANFHNSLGTVYLKQRRFKAAVATYRAALQLQPDLPTAHINLGLVYLEQGQFDTAISCYQQAIQLQPDNAEPLLKLSATYLQQGKTDLAISSCLKIIEFQPDNASAHGQLGIILRNQGQLTKAIASYQRALKLNQNDPKTYNNLGQAFKDQGKTDEALAYYRHAIQLQPDDAKANHNMLFSLHYSSKIQPSILYAEHRQWATRQAAKASSSIHSHPNERHPTRQLRIGYVSGDFKSHSVAYFFEPLLAAHSHQEFEIICYANNEQSDGLTERMKRSADRWRDISADDDETVASLIREDGIDILVDLSGHTKDNRMLTFARKPAPIQVSYIGYPNTTGLQSIDYRLVDAWTDPVGQTEHLHTEQLLRLAHGFLCYQPPADCPEVSPAPVLDTGQITFGSFNNLAKVNPQLVAHWAALLTAVPNSRLVLKAKPLVDSGTREYVQRLFEQHDMDPNRLILIGWTASQNQHLAMYSQVDIALDTFPYNGTTTTCEALWMGVPVITLAGQTHVSRVGVSLLSSVGLEDLIAESTEAYIQKAIDLANDLDRLQELRANLRSLMEAAPLTNATLITQSVEDAFRAMWQKWCSQGESTDQPGEAAIP